MSRKLVLTTIFMIVLIGVLGLSFQVHRVEASGTIYIRADGSIDPPTAPIATVDNITYTLTGNINDSIVVERDSIMVDGQDYTVQGTGSGTGMTVSGRSNVTIKNTEITTFNWGIVLNSSSNSTVSGNNITANDGSGISLAFSSHNNISSNIIANNRENGIEHSDSSNNSITGNNITANGYDGIYLVQSSNNSIAGNSITDNDEGICLESYGLKDSCDNNSISGNNMTNNGLGILCRGSSNNSICGNNIRNKTNFGNGIYLVDSSNYNSIIQNNITDWFVSVALQSSFNNSVIGNNIANSYDGIRFSLGASDNSVYHNNFINNTEQVYFSQSGYANLWHDGYPSGGNYWSDYVTRYPNASEIGTSGIWNTAYVIDSNNTDRYPLKAPYVIPEFPSFLILPLFFIATLLAVIIYRRKHPQNE
jgi:parallel beta-helix repeat protein